MWSRVEVILEQFVVVLVCVCVEGISIAGKPCIAPESHCILGLMQAWEVPGWLLCVSWLLVFSFQQSLLVRSCWQLLGLTARLYPVARTTRWTVPRKYSFVSDWCVSCLKLRIWSALWSMLHGAAAFIADWFLESSCRLLVLEFVGDFCRYWSSWLFFFFVLLLQLTVTHPNSSLLRTLATFVKMMARSTSLYLLVMAFVSFCLNSFLTHCGDLWCAGWLRGV